MWKNDILSFQKGGGLSLDREGYTENIGYSLFCGNAS